MEAEPIRGSSSSAGTKRKSSDIQEVVRMSDQPMGSVFETFRGHVGRGELVTLHLVSDVFVGATEQSSGGIGVIHTSMMSSGS